MIRQTCPLALILKEFGILSFLFDFIVLLKLFKLYPVVFFPFHPKESDEDSGQPITYSPDTKAFSSK